MDNVQFYDSQEEREGRGIGRVVAASRCRSTGLRDGMRVVELDHARRGRVEEDRAAPPAAARRPAAFLVAAMQPHPLAYYTLRSRTGPLSRPRAWSFSLRFCFEYFFISISQWRSSKRFPSTSVTPASHARLAGRDARYCSKSSEHCPSLAEPFAAIYSTYSHSTIVMHSCLLHATDGISRYPMWPQRARSGREEKARLSSLMAAMPAVRISPCRTRCVL